MKLLTCHWLEEFSCCLYCLDMFLTAVGRKVLNHFSFIVKACR